jgi:hypothetical protein
MGVGDVKRRLWLRELCELGLCVLVLQLFLGSRSFVNCTVDPASGDVYDDDQCPVQCLETILYRTSESLQVDRIRSALLLGVFWK